MTGRAIPLVLFAAALYAQTPGTIQTIVGTGSATFSGDGGPAKSAALNVAVDVFADRSGNLFIADQNNHRIRKVTPDGNITTVAGNGTPGYSGDGGPATSAQINTPTGVCTDPAGNIYIADVGNQRIRKVFTSGTISTIAGTGAKSFGGDGGQAIGASFYNAVRVAIDPAGNLLVADQSNHRIRRIALNGVITTIAGNGAGTPANGAFAGDGSQATAASLNNPTAVATDNTGVIYIADQFNQRIRRVGLDGVISTVAGNGAAGFAGDNGPATSASLNYPGAIATDSAGTVYFNDDVNYRTRRISTNGTITTVAGNGSQGFSGDGGPATSASLNGNFGIALDALNNIYIADSANNRIREILSTTSTATPTISAAGFTNAASYLTGGSPGGIATIFGARLTLNVNGFVQNTGVPLPMSLGGATVMINGKIAPFFNAVNQNGQEQISVQIPVDTTPGGATLTVNNGAASATVQVVIASEQPGIFTIDGSRAAALHSDGTLVDSTRPAAPGETVVVFCTGLGPVSPPVATGAAASGSVLSPTVATYRATLAGQDAPVAFSGLAPNFVALNQVNLTVPAGTQSGLQDLILTSSNNAVSNTVKLTIR